MSIALVMSAQALVATMLFGAVYCYQKGRDGSYLAFAGFVVQVLVISGLLLSV